MRKATKIPGNLIWDFYLPCAVSGLLLAGLIFVTNPASPPESAAETAVVTMAAR
jgi:hypothetical protein